MENKQPENMKIPTIKFDIKDEEILRQKARKEYIIAKNFKIANLPLYKFYSATEISPRKQFNLGIKNDLTVFEIKLCGNQETDFDRINEAKDFIQSQENITLIDDKLFKYTDSTLVQRFLIKCN
jgi:hypothetical protein